MLHNIMKLKVATIIASILLCTLAHSQQTVEELSEKIEVASKEKSIKSLTDLRFTTGEPKELSSIMDAMFALFGQKRLHASKPMIYSVEDYTPKQKLPGSFQGRELEYLVPPTHWIVVTLSSADEEQLTINVKLTIPTAKIDGVWRILGAKYK